jgi:hypothetical protein
MTAMDITIDASFLPHEEPEASLALYRDTLGFEVRNDVEYGPGITDDERRTIAEMMAKGTYASINMAPRADRPTVRGPRLRLPRSCGQPDPHPGTALSRPAIADTTCTDGTVKEPAHGGREGGPA